MIGKIVKVYIDVDIPYRNFCDECIGSIIDIDSSNNRLLIQLSEFLSDPIWIDMNRPIQDIREGDDIYITLDIK